MHAWTDSRWGEVLVVEVACVGWPAGGCKAMHGPTACGAWLGCAWQSLVSRSHGLHEVLAQRLLKGSCTRRRRRNVAEEVEVEHLVRFVIRIFL